MQSEERTYEGPPIRSLMGMTILVTKRTGHKGEDVRIPDAKDALLKAVLE